MTAHHLRKWRLQQRHTATGKPWTQQEAGEWYGCTPVSAARSWRRWESGAVPVPRHLEWRIVHDQCPVCREKDEPAF